MLLKVRNSVKNFFNNLSSGKKNASSSVVKIPSFNLLVGFPSHLSEVVINLSQDWLAEKGEDIKTIFEEMGEEILTFSIMEKRVVTVPRSPENLKALAEDFCKNISPAFDAGAMFLSVSLSKVGPPLITIIAEEMSPKTPARHCALSFMLEDGKFILAPMQVLNRVLVKEAAIVSIMESEEVDELSIRLHPYGGEIRLGPLGDRILKFGDFYIPQVVTNHSLADKLSKVFDDPEFRRACLISKADTAEVTVHFVNKKCNRVTIYL